MNTPITLKPLLLAALVLPVLSACVVVPLPTASQFPADAKLATRADGSVCSVAPITRNASEGTTEVLITESCERIEVALANKHPEHPKLCNVQLSGSITEIYLQVGDTRTLSVTSPNEYVPVYMKCQTHWNRTR